MTTVVLNTVTRKVEVFSSARDVHARAEIADHKAAANPHPQYLADADLAEVARSGDAGDLTAGTVPDARMPNWTGYSVASRTALEAANVPAAVDGLRLLGHATVGDGGGAHYKRVPSEPLHPHKIQSADGAWWEELFAVDVTVNIPSDFATLQEAINRLSKQPVRHGARIILNIESGHALTVGLTVVNGDYSRFTITSADAEVTLDAGWTSGDHVARGVNAKMPNWGILLDCGNKDIGALGAINVETNSDLQILDGCGAKNAGVAASNQGSGIFVYRNSRVTGYRTVFSGCAGHAAWITHRSAGYLERANFSGSGSSTAGVFLSRAATLYAAGADFSDSAADGLLVRRSFAVIIPHGAQATLFDNNAEYAIAARMGSKVVAHARAGHRVTFSNCLTHGIEADAESVVDVSGALFSTVAFDAIRAIKGARIFAGVSDATAVSMTGIGRNAVHCDAAKVVATSLSAPDVAGIALLAQFGGEIIANSAVCTGALGTAAVSATTGSRISCYGIDVSNAAAKGLYAAFGSEISASNSTGTGAGTYGVHGEGAATILIPNSDYSGAGLSGATIVEGGRLVATATNLQMGASAAVTDLQVSGGSIASFVSGTGGTNVTVNTLAATGIIFQ